MSLRSNRAIPMDESLVYNAPPALASNGKAPQPGFSPSGTMNVRLTKTDFPGTWRTKTIEIIYEIPPGIQQDYHTSPGSPFEGTTRVAFLPNSSEGLKLLDRLKCAWLSGQTFTIGTSMTTGKSNVVVWSSIPHKTNLRGGKYGFPDSKYISKCNRALDALAQVSLDPQAIRSQQRIGIHQHVVKNEKIIYSAPASLADSFALATSLQTPSSAVASGDCSICLDELSRQRFVHIKGCEHAFHFKCISDYLNHELKCPICRAPIGDEPQGKGPSGTMTIKQTTKDCPGFSNAKAIEITYNIPSGIQSPYHDHPGTRFGGANRTAFLPDNDEGRRLLTRLKFAFLHGLTFRVGTSLTSGVENVVTWSSIHHKTSLRGGVHGFPDNSYISNVNGSLDALHVPVAEDC